MERGLYIAASGMLAEQVRQRQIANDLANASTPGYKADRTAQAAFAELTLRNRATGATIGSQSLATRVDEVRTDFSSQPARETGEPLDLAISGEGFFAVRTPDGVRYTRNGQFGASGAGELVTAAGHPVLGPGGRPVRVGADGAVDPRAVAVVLLRDPAKVGDGLVTGAPGGPGTAGEVRAGALEGSGSDPARAMVDMIASLRAFEAGQKVIATIDETLGKAANQLGSAT